MSTATEAELFKLIRGLDEKINGIKVDVEVLKVRSGSLTMKNMFIGLGAIGTFLAGMGLNI